MKTFEQYNINDEKEMEELFLEIAHLDELEIRFDFIKYNLDLFYFYNDEWLFSQDKKFKNFYLNHKNIWLKFGYTSDLNKSGFRFIIRNIVNKHFNLTDYSVGNLSIVNW